MSQKPKRNATNKVFHNFNSLLENATSSEEVLWLVDSSSSPLNMCNVATAVNCIAKCSDDEPPVTRQAVLSDGRFRNLVNVSAKNLRRLEVPRTMTHMIWGLGKLEARFKDAEPCLQRIREACPAILSKFTSREVSSILWGLAKLQPPEDAAGVECLEVLAHDIIISAASRLPQFSAQSLANILWALPRLNYRISNEDDFVHRALAEVRLRLHDFNAIGRSSILWAVAKLEVCGHVSVPLTVEILQTSKAHLHQFREQPLCMIVYASAKIITQVSWYNISSEERADAEGLVAEFVTAATVSALQRIHKFVPQGLSTLAWALATLELEHSPVGYQFISCAAQRAVTSLDAFPPQAVANLTWAWSKVAGKTDEWPEKFSSAVATKVLNSLHQFTWQDLAIILTGLSRLPSVQNQGSMVQERVLATAIAKGALQWQNEIDVRGLLNIATACMRLKVDQQTLRDLVVSIKLRADSNQLDVNQWRDLQKHINSSPTSQPNQEEIRVPEERVPTPEWESEYDGASDVPDRLFETASFSPRDIVDVPSGPASDRFEMNVFDDYPSVDNTPCWSIRSSGPPSFNYPEDPAKLRPPSFDWPNFDRPSFNTPEESKGTWVSKDDHEVKHWFVTENSKGNHSGVERCNPPADPPCTTVMLCGLPATIDMAHLLRLLESWHILDLIDYVYLTFDMIGKRRDCLLNFTVEADCNVITSQLRHNASNSSLSPSWMDNLVVIMAGIQGLEENIDEFSKYVDWSNVHPDTLPYVALQTPSGREWTSLNKEVASFLVAMSQKKRQQEQEQQLNKQEHVLHHQSDGPSSQQQLLHHLIQSEITAAHSQGYPTLDHISDRNLGAVPEALEDKTDCRQN